MPEPGMPAELDASHNAQFAPVLPEGFTTLEAYLNILKQEATSAKSRKFIGFEVMGPGRNVFRNGIFTKSAGNTLVDGRSSPERREDTTNKHKIIEGDVYNPQVMEKIKKWLGSDTLNVIFFKPGTGTDTVPRDPFLAIQPFVELYQVMAEESVLFAEVPAVLLPYLPRWQKILQEVPGLELIFPDDSSVISLRRRKGAPNVLPLVPAREVLGARRTVNI